MKGIAVNARIQLLDVDRPGEIFEVELEATTPTRLALSVPNTIIRFDLYRQDGEPAYCGSLGGRHFVFTPPEKARKSAAKRGSSPRSDG